MENMTSSQALAVLRGIINDYGLTGKCIGVMIRPVDGVATNRKERIPLPAGEEGVTGVYYYGDSESGGEPLKSVSAVLGGDGNGGEFSRLDRASGVVPRDFQGAAALVKLGNGFGIVGLNSYDFSDTKLNEILKAAFDGNYATTANDQIAMHEQNHPKQEKKKTGSAA